MTNIWLNIKDYINLTLVLQSTFTIVYSNNYSLNYWVYDMHTAGPLITLFHSMSLCYDIDKIL